MFSTHDYLTKDFFELIGLESLPEEQKADYAQKISDIVLAKVYLAIQDELTAPEKEEYDSLKPEEVVPWLTNKSIDVEALFTNEMIRYRLQLAQTFEIASHDLLAQSQPGVA